MTGAFIGTTDGVFTLRDGALERLGLEGREVSALHAGAGGLLAGTTAMACSAAPTRAAAGSRSQRG